MHTSMKRVKNFTHKKIKDSSNKVQLTTNYCFCIFLLADKDMRLGDDHFNK